MTHYEVLGVPRNASPGEIRHAYRRLASKYHPDRKGGDTQKFQIIQRAYDTLGDAGKRARYDEFGDEPRGSSLRERALQEICTLVMAAIHGNPQMGVEPVDIETDLLAHVRRGVNAAIEKNLPKMIKDLEAKIKLTKRAAGKIRRKSGENLVSQMLDRQTDSMREHIKVLERQFELAREVLKLLEDYSYDVQQQLGSFLVSMSGTSSPYR